MTRRALILARGLGTRMRAADAAAVLDAGQARAADAGLKAMMPVHGRPFLDYVLSALADAGITDAALVVAPEHAAIRQHYERDFPPARLRVSFVVQRDARGTADAVVAAERWCADEAFLTLNADNLYPPGVLADVVRLAEPGLPVFSSGDLVATSQPGEGSTFTLTLPVA